jgi:hypothetical protein
VNHCACWHNFRQYPAIDNLFITTKNKVMKKSMTFAVAAMLFAAATSYGQSTSGSGGQAAGSGKQAQGTAPAGQNGQGESETGAGKKTGTGGQEAQKSLEEDGSTKPGGDLHKNANDVGRYSNSNDERTMLNSKEALEARKKNLTEADTTVKKGSGSGDRNMKNQTGKTGNYQNQAIKHDQKTKPRP